MTSLGASTSAAQTRATAATREAFSSFRPASDDKASVDESAATRACARMEIIARLPDIALTWWAARGLFQGALVAQRLPALSARAGMAALVPAALMLTFQVKNSGRSLRCLIPAIASATPVGEAMRAAYTTHALVGDPMVEAAQRIAASPVGVGSAPEDRKARRDAFLAELARASAELAKPVAREAAAAAATASATGSGVVGTASGYSMGRGTMAMPLKRGGPSPPTQQRGLDDLRADVVTYDDTDDDYFATPLDSDGSWSTDDEQTQPEADFSSDYHSAPQLPPHQEVEKKKKQTAERAAASSDDGLSWIFGGKDSSNDGLASSSSSSRLDDKQRPMGDEARWRERNSLPQRHAHEDVHPSYELRRKRRESLSEDRSK